MLDSVLARTRTLASGACAVLAIAGCTAANPTPTVKGGTLTIYASVPASNPLAQDVYEAERLALQQSGNRVGSFTISFKPLTSQKLSNNARDAIVDKTAIAYLGEVNPGASADSIGITNAQDLLQVSPTDTAVELTKKSGAIPNSPTRYYESLKTYNRTFARVVPNTAVEAEAQVREMAALGVKRLAISNDGSEYGKAVAFAVQSAAPPTLTVVPNQAGADALFYGASSEAAAASTFNSAAQANAKIKLFGPSALDDTTFTSKLTPATRNVYISAPGFLPGGLTPAARKFISDFKSTYRHVPVPEAMFGYAAMAGVLAVLQQAGSSANNRSVVVQDFLKLKSSSSVLGSYSINKDGDTSFSQFVFSRLKAGRLVPYKSVQG